MSASSRTARKTAVCGHKPGGEDAYYYKETCALKERRTQQPKKTVAEDNTLVDDVVKFARSESLKLIVRRHKLQQLDLSRVPRPRLGSDHLVVKSYIRNARAHAHESVRQRIRLAIETLNAKRSEKNKIVWNRVLEHLVVMGALNHYTGIRQELDPDFRIVPNKNKANKNKPRVRTVRTKDVPRTAR